MENNLPNRKPNRIKDYDYNQNGAYFVTICTQDRKHILSKIFVGTPLPGCPQKPATELLWHGKVANAIIMNISEKYPQVSVDNYVIMPDHIHLLLRIDTVGEAFRLPENDHNGTGNPSPTISNIIGWYKYQTTKQINLIQNTPGTPIFQRSFYDHVIRNQADYNEIWEYIDNNPQKWAATKQGRE